MQLKISTRIKFIFIFITIILAEYALVKYPLLTKQIIDNIENGKGKETIYLFVTLAGFIIFLNICLALQQLVKSKYLNDVKHYFKKYVFAGILRMETESITSKKQAEYISMFNNDIPMVCEDFYSTIFDVITSVIMLIFSLTALIQINIYLMLIIVACFILLALNPIFFKNCLQNKKKNISLTLKTFNQKLQDSISCIRIIKSYLASKETEQEIDEKSHIANEAKYQYDKVQMFGNLVSGLIGYASDFFVLAVGAYLIYKGQITVGSLIAVLQLANLLAGPMIKLTYQINTINAVKPLRKSLFDIINYKKNEVDEDKVDVTSIKEIELKNVSFKYNDIEILHNINLKLEKGKKYLLVGKNGSGKTTLLKLINRNYRDFKGEILINGKSCFDISSDSFYKNISMVYQEPYIFADSIQDNITMYKIYDKKSYLNIIKKVGITAEILNKDNNVQHLSGGDKQRVALARALISNPQFLLLDEACSALDIKSRGIIEKNILNEDSAVISVSHNYDENILRKYDEIIFMQDGRIIQMDRYENLSSDILNWLNTNSDE